jgi:hypothetical protein
MRLGMHHGYDDAEFLYGEKFLPEAVVGGSSELSLEPVIL